MNTQTTTARLGGSALIVMLAAACNAALDIETPRRSADASVDRGAVEASERPESDAGEHNDDASSAPEAPVETSPHAWAAWPMPNPPAPDTKNPQKYAMPGARVVTDSVTKLAWQQSVENGPYARDDAEKYCATLRLMGGGFRLPSRIELLSLVDLTQKNPSLDPKAFPDSPSGKFWSASRYAKDAERGWVVDFDFGTSLVHLASADEELLVRCVR